MTPQVLLDSLRRLLAEQPPLDGLGRYGPEQHQWLGRAVALVQEWDRGEAIGVRSAARSMAGNLNRHMNYGALQTTLYEAIAAIEGTLPMLSGQVFGPGAVYDFFVALNELVESAERSLFIVDPYLDNEVFHGYLASLRAGVGTRLLISRYAESVRVAAEKFRAQNGGTLEVRRSAWIHDRVIFIDGAQCWVLGASIKDEAAKKPTYLAPLPTDVIADKLLMYETLWSTATAI